MKLVTIASAGRGAPGAVLQSGEILDLCGAALSGTTESWLPCSLRGILEAGADGLALVQRIVDRVEAFDAAGRAELAHPGVLLPTSTPLLAPVPEPRLVVAAGLAYKSHLAEMAGTPVPLHPTAFMKSPNSIAAPDSVVRLPPGAADHVDYEGELAIVFGSRCHRVERDRALACVAGCTVANDISARDWVQGVWEAKAPWDARRTWEVNIMGKQFPSFTPLGPVLLTMDEVPDLAELHITTRLNGTVMQSAPVGDLIFDVAETISYLSRWYEFRPGDVLLTGTPAGVGVGHRPPVFMKPGDVVEVEITGIGLLRNTLRA